MPVFKYAGPKLASTLRSGGRALSMSGERHRGAMALLLGVIGIYGVIAYSVSQRTREIGIRMAIGARNAELTRMFIGHASMLAGIGVACGLLAAVALSRLMSSLLFHVNPVDPMMYGAVSVGSIAAAVLASYVPARRVIAVDPVEALRAE